MMGVECWWLAGILVCVVVVVDNFGVLLVLASIDLVEVLKY